MIYLLIQNPLLLLFTVAAIGYPLGRIKIAGSSLGVATVLFVGLAIGSLHPDLKLPEAIYLLGLVIFVYTVGLSSAPGFFASFGRRGLRDNVLMIGLLAFAASMTVLVHFLLHLKPSISTGMFAGSLTNTPALAGVLDLIKEHTSKSGLEQALAEPVVGYSITYPMGVVGMIAMINLMRRVWRVDYAKEAKKMTDAMVINKTLTNRTVRVTQTEPTRHSIQELLQQHGFDVVFGRLKRAGQLSLAGRETLLQLDDVVSVVGTPEELDRVMVCLGEASNEHIELDRSHLDFRRVFVSNPKVAGHRLKDLNLPQQFGAVVTRVRRGDIEFLPRGETVLELGDRVRVLTHRNNLEAVSGFFGDSYRALSEIDILTFSLGLALGLLVGIVPIPLPGGVVLKLGLAGGPLIVALILGTLGRTGPLIWSLPYSANLTLRQLGLIFFLAGVGTRAGHTFVTTIAKGNGLSIFLAGATITCLTTLLALWIGHGLLKIPMGFLMGVLAGMQTQPAVLGYALEETGDDLPNLGYATVYPVATITKILLAQLLVTLLH